LCVLVLGLLGMKFRPRANVFRDIFWLNIPKKDIYDAVILFVRSLLPSFRLEEALVHDSIWHFSTHRPFDAEL
jgi:hypothetical protein